ncbi:MAG: hypothetical protein ACQEQ7_09530 [Thermodesulfobacteriota bacterium]
MKLKRNISFILSIAVLLSFISPMGCGDSDSEPVENHRTLLGDEQPFYGSLLKKIISGLFEGAGQKIGYKAMGEILELLGWGSGGDQEYLDAMTQKLQEIVNLLGEIINSLKALLIQLNITEEEILANTNDPTAAITQIETAHEELQGLAQGKNPGTIDEKTLKDFVLRVENTFVIDEQINTIHDAILPPDIAKTPVLNNFASLGINRIIQGGKSLADAYLGLETYFSQLLYYQMQGVNLFVETKVFRTKAGLPQIDGMDAKVYMDFFAKKKLQPEVDNFMNNVYRLILSQVSLEDSSSFLPADTSAILSRANFFRIQVLNQDHFGLRGTLISTKDLISDVIDLNAKNIQNSAVYQGSGVLSTASGKTYDFWQGNHVSGVSDYYAISYDFGNAGDVPGDGTYGIIVEKEGTILAYAKVQSYTPDYVQDKTGTISYGHALMYKRVGAKDAFNNNATWSWWEDDLKNTGANGNASARWTGLSGGAQNDEYHGEDELDAHFIYASTESAPITLHYSAHAYGTTQSSSNSGAGGFANSKIYYRIGLFDATTNRNVHQIKTNQATTPDSGKASLNDHVSGKFVFPDPSPGHDYYVYFNCQIKGNSYYGSAKGEITIDSIERKIYLSF